MSASGSHQCINLCFQFDSFLNGPQKKGFAYKEILRLQSNLQNLPPAISFLCKSKYFNHMQILKNTKINEMLRISQNHNAP